MTLVGLTNLNFGTSRDLENVVECFAPQNTAKMRSYQTQLATNT